MTIKHVRVGAKLTAVGMIEVKVTGPKTYHELLPSDLHFTVTCSKEKWLHREWGGSNRLYEKRQVADAMLQSVETEDNMYFLHRLTDEVIKAIDKVVNDEPKV